MDSNIVPCRSLPVDCGFTGRVEIFALDADGNETLLYAGSNSVQYEGYDALGLLVSGRLTSPINAMYFQFAASGPGTARTPTPRTVTAASFRALTGGVDFLRVPVSQPAVSATAGTYLTNRVTFYGIAAVGDLGKASGLTFTTGSAVERLALVFAPDFNDDSKDYVYSVFSLPSPSIVPSSGGFGFRWQIDFTSAS